MLGSLFRHIMNFCLYTLALSLLSFQASAATVSYYLDQTNLDPLLPDGSNYLIATISDDVEGQLDFWINTVPGAFTESANFGIQAFGFNLTTDPSLLSNDDFILPDSWSADIAPPQNTMDGFGGFDVLVFDGGNSRQDPLRFSVLGLTIDDIDFFFAAHVADFSTSDPSITSGFFGGGTPVPVPAAIWLFGSGLLGLIGISRRKKTAQ